MAESESLTFDAGWLARGWLSVAQAAAKDKDRPALSKTVCVEFHGDGVRLIATDSYMLLTAWVPCKDEGDADPPSIDEAPLRTVVAVDDMGRAKGLFHYLLNLTRPDAGGDEAEIPVTLTVGPAPEITGPALIFDGAGRDCLTIAAEDREALLLDIYEGEYPNWRPVTHGFVGVGTDIVALAPDLVARLAAMAKLHAPSALRWSFGGELKVARVDVEGRPSITGFVMPVRWTGRDVVGESPTPAAEAEVDDRDVVANRVTFSGSIKDPGRQPLGGFVKGDRVTMLTEYLVEGVEIKDGPLGPVRVPKLVAQQMYDPTAYVDPDELLIKLQADNEAALEQQASDIIGGGG